MGHDPPLQVEYQYSIDTISFTPIYASQVEYHKGVLYARRGRTPSMGLQSAPIVLMDTGHFKGLHHRVPVSVRVVPTVSMVSRPPVLAGRFPQLVDSPFPVLVVTVQMGTLVIQAMERHVIFADQDTSLEVELEYVPVRKIFTPPS